MSADVHPGSVALAHHWLMSMRGGEKTLLELAEMFPDAPIYALLAKPERLDERLRQHPIRTSWLQRFAWLPNLQRKALPFLAGAARSLDATAYDVVICSDAAIIKAIRTRPDALKICYCHAPMRYVWDLYDAYCRTAGPVGRWGLRLCAGPLRKADRAAAEQVTAFVANSHAVAGRIRKNYGQPCVVIPPPVDVDFAMEPGPAEDFYLVVGEHVGYKRNDLAVEACTRLGRALVVIGTGPDLDRLRRRAGPTVRVIGWQSDEVVRDHLRRCRALLFCGEEDFGLVPVEAQAAGRPVIAYRAGGALETVVEGRTGLFFDTQTADALADAIERFEKSAPLDSADAIRDHAQQFSTTAFRDRFTRFTTWCLDHYSQGGVQKVRLAMSGVDTGAFL